MKTVNDGPHAASGPSEAQLTLDRLHKDAPNSAVLVEFDRIAEVGLVRREDAEHQVGPRRHQMSDGERICVFRLDQHVGKAENDGRLPHEIMGLVDGVRRSMRQVHHQVGDGQAKRGTVTEVLGDIPFSLSQIMNTRRAPARRKCSSRNWPTGFGRTP